MAGAPCDYKEATHAPMIKSELVRRIARQNPHLHQSDVENILNAILGEVVSAMARGDRVDLRGFGAFSIKVRRRERAAIPEPALSCLCRRKHSRSLGLANKCASGSTRADDAKGGVAAPTRKDGHCPRTSMGKQTQDEMLVRSNETLVVNRMSTMRASISVAIAGILCFSSHVAAQPNKDETPSLLPRSLRHDEGYSPNE